MARSWIAIFSGAVIALSLITGCRAFGPAAEQSSRAQLTVDPSADGSTEQTTPQEETSGSEQTGTTEAAQALVTPRLPIGGGSPDDSDAEQCAQVSFLGQGQNSIPARVGIVVTGAVFSEGIFHVGGDGCTNVDDPPCLEGFVFTRDDPGNCAVPVRTDVTRRPDEHGPQDKLSLAGRFLCPDDLTAVCRDLAQRLATDNQTITLHPPVAETHESTTESSTTESTETSSRSPTSESTSETATPSTAGG